MKGRIGRRTGKWLSATLATLLAAFSVGGTQALDWPSFRTQPARLFGNARNGHLLPGIVLGGEPGTIHASESGEMLFFRKPGSLRAGVPPIAGGIISLEHELNYRTVYTGLQPKEGDFDRTIDRGEVIGVSMAVGSYPGEGPMYFVTDRATGVWVNPSLLLPPIGADVPPVITSLAMEHAAGIMAAGRDVYPAGPKKVKAVIAQGNYAMFAGTTAATRQAAAMAPFRIRLLLNGVEKLARTFDAAIPVAGGLAFGDGRAPSGSGIDQDGRYRLGEVFVPRGVARIDIEVETAGGARRENSWTFDVR